MDEFNIDKSEPDLAWIRFRNTLIGLIVLIVSGVVLLFKFC